MEGGDAWRLAACGGDSAPPRDNMRLNRIMLRFRPIAPKPAAGSSVPAAGESQGCNRKAPLQGKRPKRKYVRVRRNSVNVKRNNDKFPDKSAERNDDLAVVTLQLMPEKEEPEQASLAEDSWCKNVDLDLTVEDIQIFHNPEPPRVAANVEPLRGLDPTVAPLAAVVLETWVTVESLTETCMEEGQGSGGGWLLGCTDAEKVKSLETDTCPGFVSDGHFGVRWVNDALKRMVVSDEEVVESLPEVVVLLKLKDNIAVWCCCCSYPTFTCGVRLQYTWRSEKCTKMVPCDVWRLDWGGFAWRLDMKTALSLGL